MKKMIIVLSLLSTSFAAHAGYWHCEGKKEVVSLGNRYDGLILAATKKGSEIPVNLFEGKVSKEGIVFDRSGKALKNVSLVFANDSFKMYEAGLNIKDGEFYIDEVATGKREYTATGLTCNYSDGE